VIPLPAGRHWLWQLSRGIDGLTSFGSPSGPLSLPTATVVHGSRVIGMLRISSGDYRARLALYPDDAMLLVDEV
jgi:hypothetical protein